MSDVLLIVIYVLSGLGAVVLLCGAYLFGYTAGEKFAIDYRDKVKPKVRWLGKDGAKIYMAGFSYSRNHALSKAFIRLIQSAINDSINEALNSSQSPREQAAACGGVLALESLLNEAETWFDVCEKKAKEAEAKLGSK